MDHAPRAAVPRFLRACARRVVPATLLASVLALGVTGGASAAPTNQTSPATVSASTAAPRAIADAPDGQVSIFAAPADGGLVQPGGPLVVELVVVNKTDAEIAPGQLELAVGSSTIDTRFALNAWSSSSNESAVDRLDVVADLATESVPPGETELVNVSVSAEGLPFAATDDFGPRAMAATLTSGDSKLAQARSTIVLNGVAAAEPTLVSTVVPITSGLFVDADEALLSSARLAEETAPGGRLEKILTAVEASPNSTVAIDPRLLASIRVLGSAAPQSALTWLDRLTAIDNQTFELPFADASLTLQSQWGAQQPLDVTNFDFDIDPANFADPAETQTPTPTPTESADTGTLTPSEDEAAGTDAEGSAESSSSPEATTTESPAPTATEDPEPVAPPLPTTESLVSFPYTMSGVVWPQAGTVQSADLDRFRDWGGESLILDDSNTGVSADADFTESAQATVAGWSAVIAEKTLDDAIDDAVHATTDEEWNEAATRIATLLAVVTRELPYEPRTLVGTVTRDEFDGDRLAQTLQFVDGLSWASATPLTFPSDADTGRREASLIDGSVGESAFNRMTNVMQTIERAQVISTIFEDPQDYSDPVRVAGIGALATGWATTPAEAQTAVSGLRNHVTLTESYVQLGDTSEALIVGRDTELPLFVSNAIQDRKVTVLVELRPTTGAVETGDAVALTIEPNSMSRVGIPIKAIANGPTYVTVNVMTPDGEQLSSTKQIRLDVRAEWESIAILVASAGLAVLFIAGLVRTIRRRLAAVAGPGAEPSDAQTSAEDSTQADAADNQTADAAKTEE
ncbi:hypothetical protein C5E07_14995 [Pseudoclavibacter sp. RFBJ3]|uniref:DUF6049 family protein n=1 Tax=unclassified Pseudoclavibacter TaxID=2615177 RepID=UPI000CE866F4|nr:MULTISPECIES: DUF6049 family protein [unclassified Pseudoclavibacter]PPF81571.1 hypothetical protein C5C12_14740 [Pseudoclavibacter sp. RFBJ5]PPF90901.1 hypothetical protein C5E07_14995 [Pseudoclavibacter sp. RFBJ3]PPG00177.1 hypothetical protein C5C19_02905 [Pseudoclavibacter sp. RFBH5]PPG20035.1 hypothetical protein C5E13_14940 [Pseudoclavibacter sp. RFBI4]